MSPAQMVQTGSAREVQTSRISIPDVCCQSQSGKSPPREWQVLFFPSKVREYKTFGCEGPTWHLGLNVLQDL